MRASVCCLGQMARKRSRRGPQAPVEEVEEVASERLSLENVVGSVSVLRESMDENHAIFNDLHMI